MFVTAHVIEATAFTYIFCTETIVVSLLRIVERCLFFTAQTRWAHPPPQNKREHRQCQRRQRYPLQAVHHSFRGKNTWNSKLDYFGSVYGISGLVEAERLAVSSCTFSAWAGRPCSARLQRCKARQWVEAFRFLGGRKACFPLRTLHILQAGSS